MAYKFYIQYSDGSKFYPDYLTHLVAIQTETLLNAFGYDTQVIPHPDEPSMKVILKGQYLARIIEVLFLLWIFWVNRFSKLKKHA